MPCYSAPAAVGQLRNQGVQYGLTNRGGLQQFVISECCVLNPTPNAPAATQATAQQGLKHFGEPSTRPDAQATDFDLSRFSNRVRIKMLARRSQEAQWHTLLGRSNLRRVLSELCSGKTAPRTAQSPSVAGWYQPTRLNCYRVSDSWHRKSRSPASRKRCPRHLRLGRVRPEPLG